ncbi:MAG: sugar transferase [Bacteroidetes bacterium]|nr:sugar transferase [Bacteroidota bacterium]
MVCKINQHRIIILLIFGDLLLLTFVYSVINLIKTDFNSDFTRYYNVIYFELTTVWIIVGLIMGKYDYSRIIRQKISRLYISHSIIVLLLLSISIVLIHQTDISWLLLFGTVFISTVIGLLISTFLSVGELKSSTDISFIAKFSEEPFNQQQLEMPITTQKDGIPILDIKTIQHIKDICDSSDPRIFSLINIPNILEKIKRDNFFILDSNNPFNLELNFLGSLSLIINVHILNDFKNINDYFDKIYLLLENGGIFVGMVISNSIRYKNTESQYPWIIAKTMIFFDFITNRIIAKMPGFTKLYDLFTNRKHYAISKTETIGRLYFKGFELIDAAESSDRFIFVARKSKTPIIHIKPSFGPIVRLDRVGLNGEIMPVYKLRTMHPYSEFLQGYIYNHGGTENGDKFSNDFRITSWGKYFRKFWLDELPMLLNLLRGDIKLVGVRPLSKHKFSIYNKDIQIRRIKYKPGLIPPFYVDLPTNLEELQASEAKYFDAYDLNPIWTDFRYFCLSFVNIVFKGKRSG